MPTQDGTEPIADEELLYRRIPVSMNWYVKGVLYQDAFEPRDDETTGISVFRAKYKSLEDAAKGKGKKGYFVAVLGAAELRKSGIRAEPKPTRNDPGHAELPDLTCHNRDTQATQERMVLLATKLTQKVEGPFPPSTP